MSQVITFSKCSIDRHGSCSHDYHSFTDHVLIYCSTNTAQYTHIDLHTTTYTHTDISVTHVDLCYMYIL